MSSDFSSFDKDKKIFDGWRRFLNESAAPGMAVLDEDENLEEQGIGGGSEQRMKDLGLEKTAIAGKVEPASGMRTKIPHVQPAGSGSPSWMRRGMKVGSSLGGPNVSTGNPDGSPLGSKIRPEDLGLGQGTAQPASIESLLNEPLSAEELAENLEEQEERERVNTIPITPAILPRGGSLEWFPEKQKGERVVVNSPGKGKPDGGKVEDDEGAEGTKGASGLPWRRGSDQTGNDETMSDIEMHNQLVGPFYGAIARERGGDPEGQLTQQEMAYYTMLDDGTASPGGAKELAAVMQEDKNQLKQIVNEIYERLIKKLKK
jgi:hypothetical protein